jgi:CRP-like cAMP-binding protein
MESNIDFSMLARNAGEVLNYAAGDTVFNTGDPGDVMYVVKSGEVDVQVDGQTVSSVAAGGMIGEMAILDQGPRSATAVARSDCELVPVDQKRFTFLVQQTPFFAIQVMRSLVTRLRATNELLNKS